MSDISDLEDRIKKLERDNREMKQLLNSLAVSDYYSVYDMSSIKLILSSLLELLEESEDIELTVATVDERVKEIYKKQKEKLKEMGALSKGGFSSGSIGSGFTVPFGKEATGQFNFDSEDNEVSSSMKWTQIFGSKMEDA